MQKVNCFLCHSAQNKTLITISRQISNETFSISQCECGFSFLNPRPSEEELSKYYTEEEYYPHSKGRGIFYRLYSVARKITYHWKLRVIKKYTDEDIDHLDYGSGDGSFSKFLNSKKNILSLSYDPYFNNSKSLETSEKKYNTITLWHVLEHIEQDVLAVENVYNLLIDGGIFLFSVPIYPLNNKQTFIPDYESIEERDLVTGHPGHVFCCGEDYAERFIDVYFKSKDTISAKNYIQEKFNRYHLDINHLAWRFIK